MPAMQLMGLDFVCFHQYMCGMVAVEYRICCLCPDICLACAEEVATHHAHCISAVHADPLQHPQTAVTTCYAHSRTMPKSHQEVASEDDVPGLVCMLVSAQQQLHTLYINCMVAEPHTRGRILSAAARHLKTPLRSTSKRQLQGHCPQAVSAARSPSKKP